MSASPVLGQLTDNLITLRLFHMKKKINSLSCTELTHILGVGFPFLPTMTPLVWQSEGLQIVKKTNRDPEKHCLESRGPNLLQNSHDTDLGIHWSYLTPYPLEIAGLI